MSYFEPEMRRTLWAAVVYHVSFGPTGGWRLTSHGAQPLLYSFCFKLEQNRELCKNMQILQVSVRHFEYYMSYDFLKKL